MELQECNNVVSFQFQINNIGRAICELEMDFKKSSCFAMDDMDDILLRVLDST